MRIFTFLAVLSISLLAFAGDEPKQPQSIPAIAALREYQNSIDAAEKVFKAAKLAANKRLVDKLKVAMTAATKAGNLDEANAIKSALDAVGKDDARSSGDGTDLLKLVDTTRDTVSGKWVFAGGALSANPDTTARLKLPVKPEIPYELRVQYSRSTGGRNVFGVYIPVGDASVALYVTPQKMGLDQVDGKRWEDNETAVSGSFGGDQSKHTINIAVWQGEEARVIVLFDGKKQIDWSGAPSKLSVIGSFSLPESAIGISSWQTNAAIYGLAVKEDKFMPQPARTKKH